MKGEKMKEWKTEKRSMADGRDSAEPMPVPAVFTFTSQDHESGPRPSIEQFMQRY